MDYIRTGLGGPHALDGRWRFASEQKVSLHVAHGFRSCLTKFPGMQRKKEKKENLINERETI
jgi:hypothetical protein